MKKIALTSLLAVFVVSGAHAANVIDGNPLYMPGENHFYSVTGLSSHSEEDKIYKLNEEFGYGITDRWAVEVSANVAEEDAFDVFAWDTLTLKTTYRALDMGTWKMDLIGAYKAGSVSLGGMSEGFLYLHDTETDTWFDKDAVNYTWSAGVRGGYVASDWTIAGHAIFNYLGDESFNWTDEGLHTLSLGLDAQYLLDSNWSVLAGAEYTGLLDSDDVENAGVWKGQVGVNYNIDETKFVGAYISGSLNHQDGDNADEWGWEKGFGFGAKFGIDF